MQRRKFIALSALGGAALGFTGVNCSHRSKAFYSILDKPQQLSYICDAKTIREIGMDYRLQTPAETDGDKLEELLTTDFAGKPVSSSSDNLYIQTLINQKIKHDFETGNTVVVRGWILAVTEARQCALLFVNSQ
jgi:hypothetical protein